MSRSTRETFSTEAESDPFPQPKGLLARIQQAVLPASWTSKRRGFEPVEEDEQMLPDPEEGIPGPSTTRSAHLFTDYASDNIVAVSWTCKRRGYEPVGEDEQMLPDPEEGIPGPSSTRSAHLL